MIFHENRLLIFFGKLEKMLQNVSSAAVVSGALRVKSCTLIMVHSVCFYDQKLSEVHLSISSGHKKQTTFSGKMFGRIKYYP